MIVKVDEDNFSIKLYRDFVKGKLVGLMEVIPIDELLEVWEKHKAVQTEPQRGCDADCNEDCNECAKESADWKDQMWAEAVEASKDEPQTDCAWR